MQQRLIGPRNNPRKSRAATGPALAILSACLVLHTDGRADMVTDWNLNLEKAAKVAAQLPPVDARSAAIVQIAVFEAVNGIERRYEPYLVTERATRGALADAAVVQAAYTTLVALYPAQTATFQSELAQSLASLPGQEGHTRAIARGLAWGEYVANRVLAARSADGFSATVPPYFGGAEPGVWRSLPTATNPDGTLPAVLPQFRFVTPFAMTSPDQFRPGPPAALTSEEYAADVNEVKVLGRVDSTVRTDEQTQLARLWQAVSLVDLFRSVRDALPPESDLAGNARLFALLSVAACDGLISVFDAKYTFNFWRPYHAIRMADTDGNPLTDADPAWTALIFAPRHQEYPSAHSIATGAMMRVLSRIVGDEHPFVLSSPGYPSFTWTFTRFSDAASQVQEARIWAGIHYRNSCRVGADMGVTLGDYVVEHLMRPVEDEEDNSNE